MTRGGHDVLPMYNMGLCRHLHDSLSAVSATDLLPPGLVQFISTLKSNEERWGYGARLRRFEPLNICVFCTV